MSFHHFHVMKDQMACCCCVPLGMAYHLVASLDIIFMILLGFQAAEYYLAATEDQIALQNSVVQTFYYELFYMFTVSGCLYSLPRTAVYFYTLGQTKSYKRLAFYFRTRIVTLAIQFIILGTMIVLIFMSIDDLSLAYDSTNTMILLMAGAAALLWIGVDLYWSAAIRTYKDSKLGKKGQQAAEQLHHEIDPEGDLYDNETRFNAHMLE